MIGSVLSSYSSADLIGIAVLLIVAGGFLALAALDAGARDSSTLSAVEEPTAEWGDVEMDWRW